MIIKKDRYGKYVVGIPMEYIRVLRIKRFDTIELLVSTTKNIFDSFIVNHYTESHKNYANLFITRDPIRKDAPIRGLTYVTISPEKMYQLNLKAGDNILFSLLSGTVNSDVILHLEKELTKQENEKKTELKSNLIEEIKPIHNDVILSESPIIDNNVDFEDTTIPIPTPAPKTPLLESLDDSGNEELLPDEIPINSQGGALYQAYQEKSKVLDTLDIVDATEEKAKMPKPLPFRTARTEKRWVGGRWIEVIKKV